MKIPIYSSAANVINTIVLLQVTLFHFEDKPRPGVSDVVTSLRDQAKLRLMMLTGDHESSAWRVAKAVGINEVYCSLKPEEKLNQVKNISRDTGEMDIHFQLRLIYFNVAMSLVLIDDYEIWAAQFTSVFIIS